MQEKKTGCLYLVPTGLDGSVDPSVVLPQSVLHTVNNLDYLIVENAKSARAFLRSAGMTRPFDELIMFDMGKHADHAEYARYLQPALDGCNMGLVSEAGVPAVADPGAIIVGLAHERGIQVCPLVGPSSLLLALMASGCNGQRFAFHGYLPHDKQQRARRIRELEDESGQKDMTQLFIETPFRNDQLLEDLCRSCRRDTWLVVATGLTGPHEKIIRKTVEGWRQRGGSVGREPAVFLMYRGLPAS